MANGIQGTEAAFLRLQKPDNQISTGLQYWGGLKAQRGAEDRARQEREGVRKNKEIGDWEGKWSLKEGDFANQYTGFNNYDDVARDFSTHAIDKYVKYQREARQALESGDLMKKRELEGKLMKVKNSFKEFSKGQKAYGELNTKYVEGAQNGSISGVDAGSWEAVMEASAVNFNVAARLDDNDNLLYTGIADFQDGQRKPFEVSNADLINGNFAPIQKQQLSGDKGVVDNILKTLGKRTTDRTTGFTTTTYQTFDGLRQKAAKDQIMALTQSDDFIADILNQMNGSTKRTGFNSEDIKSVEDQLYSWVQAGYSEEISTDFDSSRATESRKSREKKPTSINIQIKTSTAGIPITAENAGVTSYHYSIGAPITLGVGDKSFRINSLSYSPTTGQIAYEGEKLIKPKGTLRDKDPTPVWTKVSEGGFNQSQLNNFARAAGFNNASELKEELDKKNPQASQAAPSGGILDNL